MAIAKTASKYTIRIPAVDGSFAMNLHVPRGPTRLQDIVPIAQNISQIQGERSIAFERKEGREISCKAGCGACCRQLVPISAPEAFRLADHFLGLEDNLRDEFLARVDAVESAIEAAGLTREMEGLTSLSRVAASLLGGGPVMIPLSIAMRWVDSHAEWGFQKWSEASRICRIIPFSRRETESRERRTPWRSPLPLRRRKYRRQPRSRCP